MLDRPGHSKKTRKHTTNAVDWLVMACTLQMRIAMSPGQWQTWTTVSVSTTLRTLTVLN